MANSLRRPLEQRLRKNCTEDTARPRSALMVIDFNQFTISSYHSLRFSEDLSMVYLVYRNYAKYTTE